MTESVIVFIGSSTSFKYSWPEKKTEPFLSIFSPPLPQSDCSDGEQKLRKKLQKGKWEEVELAMHGEDTWSMKISALIKSCLLSHWNYVTGLATAPDAFFTFFWKSSLLHTFRSKNPTAEVELYCTLRWQRHVEVFSVLIELLQSWR